MPKFNNLKEAIKAEELQEKECPWVGETEAPYCRATKEERGFIRSVLRLEEEIEGFYGIYPEEEEEPGWHSHTYTVQQVRAQQGYDCYEY